MSRLQAGAESAELTDGVIAEVAWTLEKGLRVPRTEIVRYLSIVASVPGIRYAGGKRNLLAALGRFNATNCDIVDCLLAAQAHGRGRKVYTFDSTDFKKLDCPWVEPP
jgi:predicted nucleic acid-binding protein